MGWKMPIILLPNVSAKFRGCVHGRDTVTFFHFRSEILSIFCLCVFMGGMGHDCHLLDDLSVSEVEIYI